MISVRLTLSLRVGRWFFGRPMIFILLVCICSISSSKYLGRPPHTGDAYSKIGPIFDIYVVSPISTGRLDLRHSRRWNSFLQALRTVWWTCVFHLRLFCCHTPSNLKVSTLSIVSVPQKRGGGSGILFEKPSCYCLYIYRCTGQTVPDYTMRFVVCRHARHLLTYMHIGYRLYVCTDSFP